MRRWSTSSLLPLLLVTACTPSAFLNSSGSGSASNSPPATKSYAAASDKSVATAPPDQWQPPPDPVKEEVLPGTERISILPEKLGECADTTITSITDRFGTDLTPAGSKKGNNAGTIVRFSNSGVQVSLVKEQAIARSQIFDKVNMCLVEIPKECPAGDIRGRVYKTTNLRTKESWSLANDIKNCGA
ncbi:MAG TPA: hypothetical protein VFK01_07360 [Bradyrhizobium sp.]|jgi:hypothetical protein|nr:hypothetical protein [Bradyrhizobium sp.]